MMHKTQLTALSCVGSAGRLMLCDTSGLHRGGRSRTRPRIVQVGTYTSDAGLDATGCSLPRSVTPDQVSPAARFALSSSSTVPVSRIPAPLVGY